MRPLSLGVAAAAAMRLQVADRAALAASPGINGQICAVIDDGGLGRAVYISNGTLTGGDVGGWVRIAGAPAPIFDVRFSLDALPDFDYSTGAEAHGIKLPWGTTQFGGTGIAAIMDNGAGTQVFRIKPDAVVGRWDATGQSADPFHLTAPIAYDLKSLITAYTLRIEFAAGGFGVVGVNDTALFCGVADNPAAKPGSAAGTVANYSWLGNVAGVTAREVNAFVAGVRANIVNAGYIGTANNKWIQHRMIVGGLTRSHVDLKDHNSLPSTVTGGATASLQDPWRNSIDSAVHAFIGAHSLGNQQVIDIARVSMWATPGRVA